MLSDEQKRNINQALTETNNDRTAAAAKLGITRQRLKDIIHNNQDLRALWSKTDPNLTAVPTEAETFQGPVTPEFMAVAAPVMSEEQMAAKQDAAFTKLLASLGKTPEDVVEALSYARLGGQHVQMAMHTISGGVTMRALKLTEYLRGLDVRIAKGFAGENALAEEAMVLKSYHDGHEQLNQMLDKITLSVAARAKIQAYQEQIQNRQKGRGKTSFGPKWQAKVVAA